jgi:hypothetical protein
MSIVACSVRCGAGEAIRAKARQRCELARVLRGLSNRPPVDGDPGMTDESVAVPLYSDYQFGPRTCQRKKAIRQQATFETIPSRNLSGNALGEHRDFSLPSRPGFLDSRLRRGEANERGHGDQPFQNRERDAPDDHSAAEPSVREFHVGPPRLPSFLTATRQAIASRALSQRTLRSTSTAVQRLRDATEVHADCGR